ncbi:MAG: ATP-dependent helicase HrpB [Spirochaetaceae bacterium]
MADKSSLPIYEVIPQILDELQNSNRLVLQAPPGAGKTTCVPLELLKQTWLDGKKIIMLEPRRIAARSAAYWMAKSIKEQVGNRVGYSVHLDKKVSSNTILEVVTEGVFINRLLKDPELAGIAVVIFDEFHERSLDADLSLALVKETQEVLREDLKILVMSATLDAEPVSKYLNDAPVITSLGKCFPVDVKYLGSPDYNLVSFTVNSVITALNSETGSILVFLPGVGEIKRVEKELLAKLPKDIIIQPLFGGLPRAEQERAIEAVPPGKRKVVLSTSIAESSITINGVKVVIDSGLIRKPLFNPKNGMDSLETLQISKASADQRTGRAGRVEPGVCYRLWDNFKKLDNFDTPEIENVDFSSSLLTMAKWGYTDIKDIDWLTKPNVSIFKKSLELLQMLGAIDAGGITPKGEALSKLPLHPRLGSIITTSNSRFAANLAALLSEKDILSFQHGSSGCDIRYRLEALEGKSIISAKKNYTVLNRVKEISKSIKTKNENYDITELLITSFPDRIAKKITDGRYQMVNGSEVFLPETDSLYSSNYLIVTNSGGLGKTDKIYLAYPVLLEDILKYNRSNLKNVLDLKFIKDKNKFSAINRLKLGYITIREERTSNIQKEEFHVALLNYLQKSGLADLKWTKECLSFKDRINFLHSFNSELYPDFSDRNLTKSIEWLKFYITGITIKNRLDEIPLLEALKGFFQWNDLKRVEAEAPTHFKVPSGSNIPIDYSTGEPVLKVRLQELFGLIETPTVLNGKVPITIHLLSPASRPIQITKDLKSFWETTYTEVKKDLMGRYPKHHWPTDPYTAIPTNRVKRKK